MKNVKVTKSGRIVNVHEVRIKLIDGEEIIGIVNIADCNCERLSDFFAMDTRGYIILSRCNKDHKTMFINRKHIIWAVPVTDK